MIAIHFEAIRLMLRGVKYTTRPEPPAKEVSCAAATGRMPHNVRERSTSKAGCAQVLLRLICPTAGPFA